LIGRKPRLIAAQLLVACIGSTVMACSTESEQETQAPDSTMVEGELRAAFSQLIDSAEGYVKPVGPVQWPEDSYPHSSVQAESWQVMGV